MIQDFSIFFDGFWDTLFIRATVRHRTKTGTFPATIGARLASSTMTYFIFDGSRAVDRCSNLLPSQRFHEGRINWFLSFDGRNVFATKAFFSKPFWSNAKNLSSSWQTSLEFKYWNIVYFNYANLRLGYNSMKFTLIYPFFFGSFKIIPGVHRARSMKIFFTFWNIITGHDAAAERKEKRLENSCNLFFTSFRVK